MNKIVSALLTLCLAVAAPTMAAEYYNDPASGGRHYDCNKAGTVVEYENSDVIWLCGGLKVTKEKHLFKETVAHWEVVDPSKMYAKTPAGVKLSPEQAGEISLAQLTEPFYSSGEKRKVHALGAGLALDAIGTAVGLGGACSEAGPIAGRVPGLSLVISGGYFLHTRNAAKRTPRFFDTDKSAYFPAATHAAAGIANLLKCN